MNDIRTFPPHARPGLSRLNTDRGITQIPIHLPHPERVCKLDANECTRRPSDAVIKTLHRWLDKATMHWYPDRDAVRLRTALAGYTKLPFAYIRAFNGADEALDNAARALVERGTETLTVSPTHERFRVCVESCGGTVKKILPTDIFAKDLATIIDAIGPSTRSFYLANPDNPTGVLYSPAEIETILTRRPGVMLIVDETYYEFSRTTVADLVKTYSHLVVVRSFSPAFGLAGLRLGYALSQPENLERMDHLRSDQGVSMPAQVAGTAALEAMSEIAQYATEVRKNMQHLGEVFSSLGIHSVCTPANFILVKVTDPKGVADYLAGKLIFVRNCDMVPGLEGYLRITVGESDTTARLISAFLCMPQQLLGPKHTRRRVTLSRPPEEQVTPAPSAAIHSIRNMPQSTLVGEES